MLSGSKEGEFEIRMRSIILTDLKYQFRRLKLVRIWIDLQRAVLIRALLKEGKQLVSQARRSESGQKRENREGDESQGRLVPPLFCIDLESILSLDNSAGVEGLNKMFTHFRVLFKCVP